MKWKLFLIAILIVASVLVGFWTSTLPVQAETRDQMRVRVNAELRARYAFVLEGCDQKCVDGYATDWLKTGATFTAPFDWDAATPAQRLDWSNQFTLGAIAWSFKAGEEFKDLYLANLKREPTKAEWENFWTRPSGYDERNQAYLDLYNSSPRLDKWTDDRLYRRKQEYNGGLE